MKIMKTQIILFAAIIGSFAAYSSPAKDKAGETDSWTETLVCPDETFTNTGRNTFFILEPGYQLVLAGKEDGNQTEVTITVLTETCEINGVSTRVVEERETADGKLAEMSRNFYAVGISTHNVCYFGEDVDIYGADGKVTHEGTWREGVGGAKHGVMLPGTIKIGDRYYQEKATGVARDRAENVSINQTFKTADGTFNNCLKTRETTPVEPDSVEYKLYAPGVGLVQDGHLKLVKHGVVGK
jgi:hypothetical protein